MSLLGRLSAGLFGGGGDAAPLPGLEAGARRRRLRTFSVSQQHVNELLRHAGPTVVARARWLVRNNGYARAAVRAWGASAVGAGIKPSPLLPAETKAALVEAWLAWTDEADAEGQTDFYGLQRRVAREVFLAGECFVRLRPRRPADGLSVPLQLQLLPSEQLPLWRNGVTPAGNPVRLGIEFDRVQRDRRVAYWFARSNPSDAGATFADALAAERLVRVPAASVLHIYDAVEAGQIRGLTGYAAAMVKLFMMDSYDDAELERKRQAARWATFITHNPPPDAGVEYEDDPEDRETDVLRGQYGPGAFVELGAYEDVKFAAPADVGGGYEPFQFRTLLQIAAALGVPYSEISGDLTKANFASSRAGIVAYRTEIEAFQHAVLVFQMLRPVWNAWLDAAVLVGRVPIAPADYLAAPRRWRAMRAMTPRMAWVDPLKDRRADIEAVQAGFKSRSDVIEAEGYDAEETDARIAADRERERTLGLQFTTSAPVPGATADPQAPDEAPDPDDADAARDDGADPQQTPQTENAAR